MDDNQEKPKEELEYRDTLAILDIISQILEKPRAGLLVTFMTTSQIAESVSDHLGEPVLPKLVYDCMSQANWPTSAVNGSLVWKVSLK